MKITNKKKVAILGSTGSIGTQSLDALSRMDCEFVFLCGGHNLDLLARQYECYHPQAIGTTYEADRGRLQALLSGTGVSIYAGEKEVCEALLALQPDFILHSISGLAGLPYAFAAAQTGARIGMANKEVIVAGGDLLSDTIRRHGGELIPVDSEHSAIFQCLQAREEFSCLRGYPCEDLSRLILTASGGPFYGKSREDLAAVTATEALQHPTWKMGGKITIDCATMMNKGFEVIEASRLFGVDASRIDVVIHRQSVVHSMVEYSDHALLAQMGLPDMRTCIRYAYTFPARSPVLSESLDLLKVGSLTFQKPDNEVFPLLPLAYDVLKIGGSAPTALIAADEEAVKAFVNGRISFLKISELVQELMSRHRSYPISTYEDILQADKEARKSFDEYVSKF